MCRDPTAARQRKPRALGTTLLLSGVVPLAALGLVYRLSLLHLRAQQAAEMDERRLEFHDLFDDAPVAYHELDIEDRITRVNKTELAMLGYTRRGNGRASGVGFHRRG